MMSKSKQRSYMSLLITLIILVDGNGIYEVESAGNNCMEEERMGLLEIKHSLGLFAGAAAVDHLLPTWDVDDHTGCCEWERVLCSPTTGHVTGLSLQNIREISYEDISNKIWPLNVSIFLHFPELQSLDLSWDFLDNGIENTGLGRSSSLRKLEILNLSYNYIDNNSIFRSLGKLTSLKVLAIGDNSFEGYFPAHELAPLENLETLDLMHNSFNGSLPMQGLNKLENLNLARNSFTKSILSSLSALPSLKVLNLGGNDISVPFAPKDCKSLSRLNRLEYIGLSQSFFNESIISCLSALPSLKILDLNGIKGLGDSFAAQDLSRLRTLEVLKLSTSGIRSLTFNSRTVKDSSFHFYIPAC